MDTHQLPSYRPEEETIECWDDDEDFQCGEDIRFRTASTATSVTGFSVLRSGHRDSLSSRHSCKSDLDSNLDDDESWQLLLQDNDDHSTQDAVISAKNAGIPIPGGIPRSALLGGTIKRLGGKKTRKVETDDWSEDLDFTELKGELGLKVCRETASPDSLSQLSSLPTSSPVNRRDADFTLNFDHAPSPPKPIMDPLEKFRDNEDDTFLDVPTIKLAKSRPSTNPFASHPSDPSGQDDNFEKDLEFPPDSEPLRLSSRTEILRTPDPFTDDFDTEWAEGSIGVRFGGTRREERSNRSSTGSMLSPTLSSCLTAESEEDALEGLVLPDGPLDLANTLQNRLRSGGNNEAAAPGKYQSSTKAQDASNKDDLLSGIEVGDGEIFDPAKLTLNRNIKRKSERPASPARRSSTTVTFTSKSSSHTRIPRLSGHERPHSTHLEPVSESGAPVSKFRGTHSRLTGHVAHSSLSSIPLPATHTLSNFPSRNALSKKISREGLRGEPTSTNSQLIKTKRSVPAMRGVNHSSVIPQLQQSPSRQERSPRHTFSRRPKTPVEPSATEVRTASGRRAQAAFVPSGGSPNQSHHTNIRTGRHYRGTDSEGSCDSQQLRSNSRLSNPKQAESPGRFGSNAPPDSLAATAKHSVTKPTRRKNFGNGTELDIFDDLPTSATAENNFMKTPIRRGAPRSARNKLSQSNIIAPREETPAPVAGPTSPLRSEFTPRFARDTNASRNARQQRLASTTYNQRDREANPLAPLSTNWRTQITAHPLGSPTLTRAPPRRGSKDASKPHLIKPMGAGVQEAKSVKGMQYNPTLYKWEGNENATSDFDAPVMSHTPKPALIANVGGTGSAQVVGGMVFDPQKMSWLKMSTPQSSKKGSTPIADEEDVFADIGDLEDKPEKSARPSLGNDWIAEDAANPDDKSGDESSDEWPITEEFDVGPEFIRRQRAEEEKWRRKVGKWVSEDRSKLGDGWKWAIRDLVRPDLPFNARPRRLGKWSPHILSAPFTKITL